MVKFRYEFHISRLSREKYKFDDSLFQTDGSITIGSFHAARLFAHKINEQRDLINFPEKAAKASEIYAMGIMDEFYHLLLQQYRMRFSVDILSQAMESLSAVLTPKEVDAVIELYLTEYPPVAVHKKEIRLAAYIDDLKSRKQYANLLEEIILLWVENQNPALENYADLFPDQVLSKNSAYTKFMEQIYKYFTSRPHFGTDQENIIDLLLAPAKAAPNSILAQLDYIKTRWGTLIGDLLYKLLGSLDFLSEEAKPIFFGPGPALIPHYDQAWDRDLENFSPDRDWMPSLVLIAKNAFVWLDQLSKKYERDIQHLDQIPDEELDTLQARGFTGLWLIGLWERSRASETIKRLCGNPEALASAYSLSSYQIAQELGGEHAYHVLQDRAWQRGIRLASDMVPNHMGIDSQWVYDHPEWFVQLDYSPFPSYSFEGQNLSSRPDIEIRIEDHYFDRSDASVVFKYRDQNSGQTRYIYHGNDGTTMPWNDTAQLNYLIPEVREAVYQTILSVAKRFPIIRFDAAMTLAKKHYQRLWYPEPGSGGAIPTRAELGLTKEQFDQIMPNEFWREVVDRLAVDAPDTLLLAEAFWLMESYFVRTLGMHRVYNSAFMNMLRNEDNANYKKLIKNTLEFDPQILKRFVNFMNNPDEKTAADQFGKGDKYFGICTILATLPGLPMFGHGQVEGFTEKYGMEFKKAYWNEQADQDLVARHERQIFPLLHRRKIFSEVENFRMFDFHNADGEVVSDVFAYANFSAGQASLVVYHNKFAETSGWVNYSDPVSDHQDSPAGMPLFEALQLDCDQDYVIFKDLSGNLEYIRSIQDLRANGLFFQLHAYQTHVLADFRCVSDDQWSSYRQIYAYLNGNGVPNMEEALKELLLQPVQQPLREILNRGYIDYLLENKGGDQHARIVPAIFAESTQKLEHLAAGIRQFNGIIADPESVIEEINRKLEFALSLDAVDVRYPNPAGKQYLVALEYLKSRMGSEVKGNPDFWPIVFGYVFLHRLGAFASPNAVSFQTQSWYSEWRLGKLIQDLGLQYRFNAQEQNDLSAIVYTLCGVQDWHAEYKELGYKIWLRKLAGKADVQQFLLINRYQGVLWFNKERFETLIYWLFVIRLIEIGADVNMTASVFIEEVLRLQQIIRKLQAAIDESDYQLEKLLQESS